MNKNLKQKLNEIEEHISLTPFHRACLLTDGSLTILLEAFTNSKIKISALKQKTVFPDKKLIKELKINSDEKLNEREVILSANEKPVVYAKSYSVISRLCDPAKTDILNTDVPIGKILKKHKVETHREITEIGMKTDTKIAGILNLTGDEILWRSYIIIKENLPLMMIEEYFGEI